MPFYRYTATDRSGKQIDGTVHAADASDVGRLLAQRGFQSVQVHSSPSPVGSTAPAASKSAVFRTKRSTSRKRYFLFAQLGRLAGSGVPMVQALQTLATQNGGDMGRALADLAHHVSAGGSLADGMANWPDLFPTHVVAMVRAGEAGGFLPEALDSVSDQAGSTARFQAFHWWVWVVTVNMLLVIPLVYQVTRVLLGSFKKIDASGGAGGFGGAISEMLSLFWQSLLWPFGPAALLFWALVVLLVWWLSGTKRSLIRHRMGLGIPIVGRRGQMEAMSIFNWVLSKLSNSGLSPQAAWNLAASAVPNLEISRRLQKIGNGMTEQSKLSDAFAKERLFPPEFGSVVATGEMVGDVPGTLARLAEGSRGDFQTQTNYARVRTGCWGALIVFVTVGVVLALLMYLWYHELPALVLEGFEV